jgi:hypothetical protein
MKDSEAMAVAGKIAGEDCVLTHHVGDYSTARAIRISGCFLADVERIGKGIAAALPGGQLVDCFVWYDPLQNYQDWLKANAEPDPAEEAYYKSFEV